MTENWSQGVENGHLTAEKDGLTTENWYQNGRKHNQKIRILNLKSFVTWTLVAYFRIFGKNS